QHNSIKRCSTWLEMRSGLVLIGIIAIVWIVSITLVLVIFAREESLFLSDGIEQNVKTKLPSLLGCKMCADNSSQSLQDLSKTIIRESLIKRNLIITGSILPVDQA